MKISTQKFKISDLDEVNNSTKQIGLEYKVINDPDDKHFSLDFYDVDTPLEREQINNLEDKFSEDIENVKYLIEDIHDGKQKIMTVFEIIENINRDRSDEWQDYNLTDWKEGLQEFTEFEIVERVGEISKENIHKYYELMSDDEIKEIKMAFLLNDVFKKRIEEVFTQLNIPYYAVNTKGVLDNVKNLVDGGKTTVNIMFGVKDTLKPIDDYIAEIEESDLYQEFLFNKVDKFYLANYGTDENVEIFDNFEAAKKESINRQVYTAKLNPDRVWYEKDIGWNYEDKSDLYLESPVLEFDKQQLRDDMFLMATGNHLTEDFTEQEFQDVDISNHLWQMVEDWDIKELESHIVGIAEKAISIADKYINIDNSSFDKQQLRDDMFLMATGNHLTEDFTEQEFQDVDISNHLWQMVEDWDIKELESHITGIAEKAISIADKYIKERIEYKNNISAISVEDYIQQNENSDTAYGIGIK